MRQEGTVNCADDEPNYRGHPYSATIRSQTVEDGQRLPASSSKYSWMARGLGRGESEPLAISNEPGQVRGGHSSTLRHASVTG